MNIDYYKSDYELDTIFDNATHVTFVRDFLISSQVHIMPAHDKSYVDQYSFPLLQTDVGFANLKIEGNFDKDEIDKMELLIGGSRIVKTGEKYDNYFSFSFLHNNIFPALSYHIITLKLEHTHEAKISYDIVKIKNPVSPSELWETTIKQIQLFNELPKDGINKIKLPFTLFVEKIIVDTNIQLSELQFILDDTFPFHFTKIDDTKYECMFAKLIDFCKCDEEYVTFNCIHKNNDAYFTIYAHSFNKLRTFEGLAGLGYAL